MSTYTFTGTDSYSVADVKAVMQNTFEDIIGFANRGMITYEAAESWIEDLTYILNNHTLKGFELQLYNTAGVNFKSYKYEVVAGFLSSNSKSGGINYFELPDGTKVGLMASLDNNSSNYAKVDRELHENRKWGNNGVALQGTSTYERSYVSNSLELKRSIVVKE